jgi:hypothetical protein
MFFFEFSPFSTQKWAFSSETLLMNTSFHRILREKLSQDISCTNEETHTVTIDSEPLHLAFLLGTLAKTNVLTLKNNSYFAANINKKTSIKAPESEILRPPQPPLHLSQRQKEGWLWFWKRGAPLHSDFSANDLQKQFRRLARALHPDQNPHPKATEAFLQLREHYDNLLTSAKSTK